MAMAKIETTKTNIFHPPQLFVPSLAPSLEDSIMGLEFENEIDTNLPEFASFPGWVGITGWKNHRENSLRGYGFEHVSLPIKYEHIAYHVATLFNKLRFQLQCYNGKEYPGALPFTNSIRTSLHVHVDVGLMNSVQIVNFASVYWMLEPLLQYYCGTHRMGNLFCLRLMDSSFIKVFLKDMLDNDQNIMANVLTQESYRYGSINFNSIAKFGTLEFRIMSGVSDEVTALVWIKAIEAIRRFSLKFTSTNELRDFFLEATTASEFPEVVLGEELAKIFLSYFPTSKDLTTEIQEGFASVSQILASDTRQGATYYRLDFISDTRSKKSAWADALTSMTADEMANVFAVSMPVSSGNPWLHPLGSLTPAATGPAEPTEEPVPNHIDSLINDAEGGSNDDDWDSGDDDMPEWEDDETDLPVPGDEGDDEEF